MASYCNFGHLQLPNSSVIYDALAYFSQIYAPIHGYISALICPLGALMNVLNIVVLTRREMRNSINLLLTAIAIWDTVVMTSNLVFVIHFILIAAKRCVPSDFTYGWATFALAHAHISLVGHSSSVWLSVAMALVRYVTVRRAEKGIQRSFSLGHSTVMSAFIVSAVVLLACPVFLSYGVVKIPPEYTMSTCVLYSRANITFPFSEDPVATYMPFSLAAINRDCTKLRIAFWTTGIAFKMLPCLMLTVFICLLLKMLSTVKRRRQRLGARASMRKRAGSTAAVHHANPTDRTTKMLVTLLAVFVVTEIPQGALALASGIFDTGFRRKIYNPLGNLLDLLSLINSSLNFVILCTMSRRFRQTFLSLFLPASVYQKVATGEPPKVELTHAAMRPANSCSTVNHNLVQLPKSNNEDC